MRNCSDCCYGHIIFCELTNLANSNTQRLLRPWWHAYVHESSTTTQYVNGADFFTFDRRCYIMYKHNDCTLHALHRRGVNNPRVAVTSVVTCGTDNSRAGAWCYQRSHLLYNAIGDWLAGATSCKSNVPHSVEWNSCVYSPKTKQCSLRSASVGRRALNAHFRRSWCGCVCVADWMLNYRGSWTVQHRHQLRTLETQRARFGGLIVAECMRCWNWCHQCSYWMAIKNMVRETQVKNDCRYAVDGAFI